MLFLYNRISVYCCIFTIDLVQSVPIKAEIFWKNEYPVDKSWPTLQPSYFVPFWGFLHGLLPSRWNKAFHAFVRTTGMIIKSHDVSESFCISNWCTVFGFFSSLVHPISNNIRFIRFAPLCQEGNKTGKVVKTATVTRAPFRIICAWSSVCQQLIVCRHVKTDFFVSLCLGVVLLNSQ